MAAEVKRARVRPAIRRLAWWVGPVLLLIAAWQVWDAVEVRRFEQALSQVRGSRSAVQPQPGRGSENAVRYYAAAAILATSEGGGANWSVQAAPRAPFRDVAWALREALSRGGSPPQPVLDAASRHRERSQVVLELLARASVLEVGGSPVDIRFPTTGMHYVNRLAVLETLDSLMHGQGDTAAKLLFDRVKSLRAFDREINWLEASWKTRFVQEIATDVGMLVSRAVPSQERLVELDRAIVSAFRPDELERSIREETLGLYQRNPSIWVLEQRRFVGPLGPLYRHHLVAVLRATDDGIQAARRPWPDRIHAMNRIPERRSILPEVPRFIGAWRVLEGFRDRAVILGEAVSAARCARLVISIELFRRERGRLPESLDELTLSGDDERSLDPFSGKALHYARHDEGYVLYSVGRNFRDDSGKLAPDPPPGQSPDRLPLPDVGVRVVFAKQQAAASRQ